jgi:hypothetical protein
MWHELDQRVALVDVKRSIPSQPFEIQIENRTCFANVAIIAQMSVSFFLKASRTDTGKQKISQRQKK